MHRHSMRMRHAGALALPAIWKWWTRTVALRHLPGASRPCSSSTPRARKGGVQARGLHHHEMARRVGNAPTSTRVWSPPHCLSATAVLKNENEIEAAGREGTQRTRRRQNHGGECRAITLALQPAGLEREGIKVENLDPLSGCKPDLRRLHRHHARHFAPSVLFRDRAASKKNEHRCHACFGVAPAGCFTADVSVFVAHLPEGPW